MKKQLIGDNAATKSYSKLLANIKTRIRQAQNQAVMSVNAEMLHLYRDVGQMVAARQEAEGWGAAVIPRLADDLHNKLPELKGFSDRNIRRMIQFYMEYPRLFLILPRPVAKMDPTDLTPSDILIHREYTNAFPAKLIIERGRVRTENSNKPNGFGALNPANFTPFPKNPVIGAFFREIHRADELGSGMRKMMRYGKAYGGADPQMIEGDVFRIVVKVPEFGEKGEGSGSPEVIYQVGTKFSSL